ncbi:MAG: hypothetical protein O7G85_06790 [Planctomycetota bacterium]|nr:hypothetical protein [Planctomycetota bacterium]
MSRIVKRRLKPAGDVVVTLGSPGPTPAKDYFERVGKYVPGEVLVAYMTLVSLAATSPNLKGILDWVAFGLCLVMTPVYFKLMSNRTDPWVVQGVVSFIAFAVWAYALGSGAWTGHPWHDQTVAAFLLVVFSLVSGAIVPRSG